MKSLISYATLMLAALFFLNACTSQTETTTATQPSSSVPGEKRDATDVTPGMGPSGASANVHF